MSQINWDRICDTQRYWDTGASDIGGWYSRFDLDPAAEQPANLAWNNIAALALARGTVFSSRLREGRYFRWARVFDGPPPKHRAHPEVGARQPHLKLPAVQREVTLPVFPHLEDETRLIDTPNLNWAYYGDIDQSFPPPQLSLREVGALLNLFEIDPSAEVDHTITAGLMASLGFYQWSTSAWARTEQPRPRPNSFERGATPIIRLNEGIPRLRAVTERLEIFLGRSVCGNLSWLHSKASAFNPRPTLPQL